MFNKPFTPSWMTIIQAVGAMASVVVVVAGATWAIRQDVIEELRMKLNSYEQSENWKLPETLHQIREASAALNLRLNEKRELETLRAQVKSLHKQNGQLGMALQEKTEGLNEAERKLLEIMSSVSSVELAEGTGKDLIKDTVYLGLKAVYPSSASVILDNRPLRLTVGETSKYTFGASECKVTLVSITNKSEDKRASFKHGCM